MWLRSNGVVESRPLSAEEIQIRMDKRASPGVPYIDKNLFHKGECFPENVSFSVPVGSYVYTANQKVEILEKEKVEKGDYRLFCGDNMDSYVLWMHVFGDFFDQLTHHSRKLGFWPGCTQFGGGWDRLVRTLMEGASKRASCRDCSLYDFSLVVFSLWLVSQVMLSFVPPEKRKLAEYLLHSLQFSFIRDQDGRIVFLDGGRNKSGGAATIFLNMIFGLIVLFYSAIVANIPYELFVARVRWNLCGDDQVVNEGDLPIDIDGAYRAFGCIVKYTHYYPIDGFEYLSHVTKKVGDSYVAVPSVAKALDSLCSNTQSTFDGKVELGFYAAKLSSLILECAWADDVDQLIFHVRFFQNFLRKNPAFLSEMTRQSLSSMRTLDEARDMHLFRYFCADKKNAFFVPVNDHLNSQQVGMAVVGAVIRSAFNAIKPFVRKLLTEVNERKAVDIVCGKLEQHLHISDKVARPIITPLVAALFAGGKLVLRAPPKSPAEQSAKDKRLSSLHSQISTKLIEVAQKNQAMQKGNGQRRIAYLPLSSHSSRDHSVPARPLPGGKKITSGGGGGTNPSRLVKVPPPRVPTARVSQVRGTQPICISLPPHGDGKNLPTYEQATQLVAKPGSRREGRGAPLAYGNNTRNRGVRHTTRVDEYGRRVENLRGEEMCRVITGAAGFPVNSFRLNPGLADVFPYACSAARRYEMYRFNSLSLEFRPIIAATASGALMGYMDYDGADAIPESEQDFLNNSEACVGTVWQREVMVRADPARMNEIKEHYVRFGVPVSAASDIRLYDSGVMHLATSHLDTGLYGDALGYLYWVYDLDLIARHVDEREEAITTTKTYIISAPLITNLLGTGTITTEEGNGPYSRSNTAGSLGIQFALPGFYIVVFDIVSTTPDLSTLSSTSSVGILEAIQIAGWGVRTGTSPTISRESQMWNIHVGTAPSFFTITSATGTNLSIDYAVFQATTLAASHSLPPTSGFTHTDFKSDDESDAEEVPPASLLSASQKAAITALLIARGIEPDPNQDIVHALLSNQQPALLLPSKSEHNDGNTITPPDYEVIVKGDDVVASTKSVNPVAHFAEAWRPSKVISSPGSRLPSVKVPAAVDAIERITVRPS